jgi:uncharacterized membrane-anchored protein YitT (DUF2179 family)
MQKAHFSKKFYWKDYLNITLGAALYSFGLIGFIRPAEIVMGGLSGVALLVEYSSGIPLQYTFFIANVVLLLVALKILGFKFLIKTIYCVLATTFFLSAFSKIITQPIVENEMLMSGIIGGILCGAGMGFVFGANGSTGGVNIIVSIINKYKNLSFGRGVMLLDLVIICCSLFVFRDFIKIIHGLIVMGVMIYAIDLVINGFRQSVQFMIFSSKYALIADAINSELNRGCTVLDGTGWYSKNPAKVIVLLARQSEASEIFRLIKSIDEKAFISQSSVRGVWGQGFEPIRKG